MIEIETKRLLITPYEDKYLDDLFIYRSDSRIYSHYSIKPNSREELSSYIKKYNRDFCEENSYTLFVIKLKSTQRLIGDIAIKNWGKEIITSAIGYAISPEYQKQGYAKESVKGFCDYLFSKHKRKRIQADVDSKNRASMSVLEYCGFKNEQTFYKKHEETGEDIIEYMYGINASPESFKIV